MENYPQAGLLSDRILTEEEVRSLVTEARKIPYHLALVGWLMQRELPNRETE